MMGKVKSVRWRLGRLLSGWHPFTLASFLAEVALALGAVLLALDTVGRYAFSKPIAGAEEILLWVFLPAVWMLPLAYVQRQKANIKVVVLTSHLSLKTQRVMNICCHVLTIGLLVPLSVGGFYETYVDWVNKTWIQAPFVLYYYPSRLICTVGIFFLLVQMIMDVVNMIRKRGVSI